MQLHFFLCTMLIIASEALHEDLPGFLVPRKIERKKSGFAPSPIYPNTNRFLSGDVNPPTLFIPYSYEAPVPVPFKTRNGKDNSLPRLGSRRRFGETFLRKRKWGPSYPRDMADSFIFNTPGYSEYLESSNIPSTPHRDYTSLVSYGPAIGHRNNYAVHSCHETKKGEPKFLRKRPSALERQYWDTLRNKNKRNANNSNGKENTSEKEKKVEGMKLREIWRKGDTAPLKNTPHGEETTTAQEMKENQPDTNAEKDARTPKSVSNNPTESSSKPEKDSDTTEHPVSSPKPTSKDSSDSPVYKPRSNSASFLKNVEDLSTLEEDMRAESNNFHLRKLKEILEEVEVLLRTDLETKEKSRRLLGEKHEEAAKLERSDKSTGSDKVVGEKMSNALTLKDKIDRALPILVQISEDLLKMSNKTNGRFDKDSNGQVPRCTADGTWTSKEFGLDMTFKMLPNMMLKVTANAKTEGVINKKWAIQGLTMSKEGGPLILAAVCPQKRKVASFLGQCKICKEQDIIFGSWTFFTFAQKFTDLWKAVEIKMDVLKRKV